MSLKWQHRSFLISLPLTKRSTTIQEQNTTERILKHAGEAEALPFYHRVKQTHLKDKRSSYMSTSLPLLQANRETLEGVSSGPPISPLGKKNLGV